MPFDSRDYNFVITPPYNLKDRVSEYFPPLPSENTNTVNRSTKKMGRDKLHQTTYPIFKQFYSLIERFMYDYDYIPKEAPERPLIVPIEALEPCEEYHT